MKKGIIILIVLLSTMTALHAEENEKEESFIKKGTKSVIKGFVSTGKNAISGIKEGIEDGRKSGESTDKAILVSNGAELVKTLKINAESLTQDNDSYTVTLAVRNDNDQFVRVTNLADHGAITLYDKDDFSTPLSSPMIQGSDITIIANSAIRVKYEFYNVENEPVTIRILGETFKLPAKK